MVRASKSRLFIGLAMLVLTIGSVAIFHSSQQQLDEMRQMEIRCEQQQEALNSQILSERFRFSFVTNLSQNSFTKNVFL